MTLVFPQSLVAGVERPDISLDFGLSEASWSSAFSSVFCKADQQKPLGVTLSQMAMIGC